MIEDLGEKIDKHKVDIREQLDQYKREQQAKLLKAKTDADLFTREVRNIVTKNERMCSNTEQRLNQHIIWVKHI